MKDINQILAEYQAEHHAVAELVSLSSATDEVIRTFEFGREHNGETLPWRKTESLLRFRPKELTIWAGYNGHGKTLILSDIMAHSVTQGYTWAVASLEMPLARLAERFVIQCSCSQTPTADYVRKCLSWTDDRIFVFDELDSVEADRILAFAEMSFRQLKVDHVVIDSLVKCGVDSEHNEPQKKFVDRLQRVAKVHGGHIHLVHHLRKGMSEEQIPGKLDLKGAGELSDLADNVILVHRNKAKEKKCFVPDYIPDPEEPDARLIVDKQRHYEWTGSLRLWFHKEGLRYVEKEGERPRWYGPTLEEMRKSG